MITMKSLPILRLLFSPLFQYYSFITFLICNYYFLNLESPDITILGFDDIFSLR